MGIIKKVVVYLTIFFIVFIVFIVALPIIGIFYESSTMATWYSVVMSNKTQEGIIGSVIVALIAVVINIVIGTPVGVFLGRDNSPLKKIVEILVIMPIIIPGFITSMGIQYLFIKLGLIDTYIGVGIVHSIMCFPYYIRSISTGYKLINRGYERMGRILGASSLEIFFKINFPMLIPAFLAGISLVVIVSFAQYLITLIIGGGEIVTIPILMLPYMSGGDLKVGGVYSIIYIVVNLILLLFLEKCIKGITKKRNKGKGRSI